MTACLAALGSLVVYFGGVRLLLQQFWLWLATWAPVVRRAFGYP
jgi:hypothetical protein